MSLEELANVEVTSVSKSAQSLSSAPASIYVITREEILRSGVLSIPEALRLAPNLQVTQFSSSDYSNGARGFAGAPDVQNFSNKILILIDGRSVYSPLFSGVAYDMQDVLMDDIDRIEVISGPGATLWGANAMNGVINIITRSARETRGTLLRLDAGPEEQAAALRYGGELGDDGGVSRLRQGVRSRRHRIRRRRQRRGRLEQVAGRVSPGRGLGPQPFHRPGRLPDAPSSPSQRFATCRFQRRQPARPMGTCGRPRGHALAGVSSIAWTANGRRAAWRSTSTPTTSICSKARMSARGITWSGAWAGAPTTTTRSTTIWRSCPTIARSSSPTSSCRTPSRSTKS